MGIADVLFQLSSSSTTQETQLILCKCQVIRSIIFGFLFIYIYFFFLATEHKSVKQWIFVKCIYVYLSFYMSLNIKSHFRQVIYSV